MNRVFKYDGKGKKADFNVTSTLSDEEAIDALTGGEGITPGTEAESFPEKCAFEIHKAMNGFRARDNMIAWGFKLAEEGVNPPGGVTLSPFVLANCKFRKPLNGETDGEPFKVALCGPKSKHFGDYCITDGGPFRSNRFYGYATPSGEWTPTRATPESVITKLTGGA
jgi:hypothetical protein